MNRDQQFDFAGFFNAKLKERNVTLRKLSELSGIALNDLQNLSEGDFERLPPGPYLRGYTLRIAKILDFDPEIWWHHFENIGVVQTSGAFDRLPHNRFAIPKAIRYGWVVVLVVLALLYGGLRFSKILGRPILAVTEPSATPVTVSQNPLIMRGTLEGGDQLLINNKQVPVEEGRWETPLALERGLNTIAIRASKFLGKSVEVQWQIIYEPPLPTPTSTPEGVSSSSLE